MAKIFQLVCLILLSVVCGIHSVKLETKFLWKEVEFAWPAGSARQEAIASGQYKVENNLPLGLDIWRDKLFITVPR